MSLSPLPSEHKGGHHQHHHWRRHVVVIGQLYHTGVVFGVGRRNHRCVTITARMLDRLSPHGFRVSPRRAHSAMDLKLPKALFLLLTPLRQDAMKSNPVHLKCQRDNQRKPNPVHSKCRRANLLLGWISRCIGHGSGRAIKRSVRFHPTTCGLKRLDSNRRKSKEACCHRRVCAT